ncbi:MAG: outer membrane protein assembly factor BamD, partial [Myxococcota bacterium]
PSAEKDQASTRMAISAFRDMLARYPKGKSADKARERLDESRRKLANHEMYVARFYFARERYAAAVSRANGLVRDYPGLGLDAEALMLAARGHRRLGDEDKARTTWQRLKSEQPDSAEAAEAVNLLGEFGPRQPPHHHTPSVDRE